MYRQNHRFLSFSPKLAKILKLYSKFWRITLKNVKNVTKNLILTILWASFVAKTRFLVQKVQSLLKNPKKKTVVF